MRGPVPKAFRQGTHRTIDPRQTVAKVRGLMPVLGITRVADITGLDTIGIPTVTVCRPNSRSLSVAQGKGLTRESAEASGLMEALELFHAERIHLPLKLGSLRELCTFHRMIEVQSLLSNESLFHENLQLLWLEGVDLLNQESAWLPLVSVSVDFTLPLPAGHLAFKLDSNGLASGNHRLEALSHALGELLERDARARFDLLPAGEQARRRLDLATVGDAGCREVLARYQAAGVAVAVWDITSASGVPAFHCCIVDREDQGRHLGSHLGMGCHPCRGIALLRALTEAAQSRLTDISGSRDDIVRGVHRSHAGSDFLGRIRAEVQDEAFGNDFRSIAERDFDTFDEEVSFLLERSAAAGARRVVVVDLTHPALGIPVVRAVAPGLLNLHH